MLSLRNRADSSARKSPIAMRSSIIFRGGSRRPTGCSPYPPYPLGKLSRPLPKGRHKRPTRRSLVLRMKSHHCRGKSDSWKKQKYNQIHSHSLSPNRHKTSPNKSPSCARKRPKSMNTWSELKHTLLNSWSRYNKIKQALMQPSLHRISN